MGKRSLGHEIAAGNVIESLEDIESLAIDVVSCKNSWFSRGGYSPAQIVYGRNPRLPAELLSDASQHSPGWSDVLCDPSELDTPAFEFRKAHQIRERARQLAMDAALTFPSIIGRSSLVTSTAPVLCPCICCKSSLYYTARRSPPAKLALPNGLLVLSGRSCTSRA